MTPSEFRKHQAAIANAVCDERDALRAENERLRGALRKSRAYIAIAATHNKSIIAAKMLPELDAVLDDATALSGEASADLLPVRKK